MTNSWVRKSMAVIAFAGGVAMLGGGVAHAADSAATETVPVVEGGSTDQNATNVCGNVAAKDSIVINFTDCRSIDANVDADLNHHRHHRFSGLGNLGGWIG